MEAHPSRSIVLLIEDDTDENSPTRGLIDEIGANCYRVTSVEQAESILNQNAPDVVIVDHSLPDGTGIELIALLRQNTSHRGTPIILLTGEIDAMELERAVMMGIYAFLAKPFDGEEFKKLVGAAIADEANRVPHSEE
ncbi:MAG: response regulator [Planctomycetes bacterium]|nr:response regulator [Planctomycetota bacterium]